MSYQMLTEAETTCLRRMLDMAERHLANTGLTSESDWQQLSVARAAVKRLGRGS